jgi:acetyl-CoA carboxylase biotin carboxyl carrier protein
MNVEYSLTPSDALALAQRIRNRDTEDSLRDHGTVWKISLPGTALDADDTIMTLESMKMEIPVLAPQAGRLIELLVAKGAPVREGQDLAVLKDT